MPKYHVTLRGTVTVDAKSRHSVGQKIALFFHELQAAYMKWDLDPVQDLNIEVENMEEMEED